MQFLISLLVVVLIVPTTVAALWGAFGAPGKSSRSLFVASGLALALTILEAVLAVTLPNMWVLVGVFAFLTLLSFGLALLDRGVAKELDSTAGSSST